MPTPTPPTIDYNVSIDTNVGSQRIDFEYSDQLVHQRESSYPFTAFMIKMAMEKSITSTIYWFDTRPAPEQDTVSTDVAVGASAGTSVSVVVSNAKYFKVNDTVEFYGVSPGSGETNMGFVTAVTTATNTLTVKPYDPTLIISAIPALTTVNILFTSYEQASSTTTPSLTRPIRGSNTSTILRDSYQVSKTYENERFYGAPERSRARAEKEIRHLVDLNKVLLFGKDLATGGETSYATSGNIRTTTKGFENFISTNSIAGLFPLTSTKLFDAMTQIHQNAYGADGAMDRRLVFCSASMLTAINTLTLGAIRFQNYPSTWGANVTQVMWSGWTWDLVQDPTLTRFRPGQAFVIQPRYIRYRPYRTTTFRANVQNPEVDYVKDEFLTEPNLEVRLEEVHAILKP